MRSRYLPYPKIVQIESREAGFVRPHLRNNDRKELAIEEQCMSDGDNGGFPPRFLGCGIVPRTGGPSFSLANSFTSFSNVANNWVMGYQSFNPYQ
jgi:hypothetical protein